MVAVVAGLNLISHRTGRPPMPLGQTELYPVLEERQCHPSAPKYFAVISGLASLALLELCKHWRKLIDVSALPFCNSSAWQR